MDNQVNFSDRQPLASNMIKALYFREKRPKVPRALKKYEKYNHEIEVFSKEQLLDIEFFKSCKNRSYEKGPTNKKNVITEFTGHFKNSENNIYSFIIKKTEQDIYVNIVRSKKIFNVKSEMDIRYYNKSSERTWFHIARDIILFDKIPEELFHKYVFFKVVFETEELAQQFLELAIKNCKKIGQKE